MFKCILGERESGKSVFVEDQIKKRDKKVLYIATLPNLKIYTEIIQRHQKRRPFTWECVELFEMSTKEILTYPYLNYKNVILDNLSYFLLFQIHTNRNNFWQMYEQSIFSLLDKIAEDHYTTFHIVDTPISLDIYEHEDKNRIFQQIFSKILDRAKVIERFYNENRICQLTVVEAKNYLFYT